MKITEEGTFAGKLPDLPENCRLSAKKRFLHGTLGFQADTYRGNV
jgi:hypothetical protein